MWRWVQVLVFGSFSESEAHYFQSSPSVANGPQGVGVLSPPQHNGGSQELKGQSGPVVSKLWSVQSKAEVQREESQDGAQECSNIVSHPQAHDKIEASIFSITPDSGGEVAVPSVDAPPQNTVTPPTGTLKTDGAAPGDTGLESAVKSLGFESSNGFEKVNGFGRDGHAGSVERPLKQLPPKSWASLVGVQAVGNDAGRSSGQNNKAPAAAFSKPKESIPGIQPRGLLNTGNSCFVNATLQALLSCPPFLQLLLSVRSRSVPQVSCCHLLQVRTDPSVI